MESATLNTNILPADNLLRLAEEGRVDVAVISVTEREVEGSSFQSGIARIEVLPELWTMGEQPIGSFVLGSEDYSDRLEEMLRTPLRPPVSLLMTLRC